MTYRILYGPVLMNSASADPGVTAYWVFSSVRTLTRLPPPSPPPPHLFLWSGPENDQHSESNGKLKTLSCYFVSSALSCVGENGLVFHAAAPFVGVELQHLRIDYQQPCGGLLPVLLHIRAFTLVFCKEV